MKFMFLLVVPYVNVVAFSIFLYQTVDDPTTWLSSAEKVTLGSIALIMIWLNYKTSQEMSAAIKEMSAAINKLSVILAEQGIKLSDRL